MCLTVLLMCFTLLSDRESDADHRMLMWTGHTRPVGMLSGTGLANPSAALDDPGNIAGERARRHSEVERPGSFSRVSFSRRPSEVNSEAGQAGTPMADTSPGMHRLLHLLREVEIAHTEDALAHLMQHAATFTTKQWSFNSQEQRRLTAAGGRVAGGPHRATRHSIDVLPWFR